MSSEAPKGFLQLVCTPIGNLGEVCPRATQTLQEANRILCENTSTALRLLTHLEITGKKVEAVHEANEGAYAQRVTEWVAQKLRVAFISEAGVPGISDPGFRLVRACRQQGLSVEAIGVPSAFLNALAISGAPTDRFLFAAFPPPKTVGRQKFFKENCFGEHTFVFYESCHRLEKSLADLATVVGPDRVVCVCAELTKLHEASQTLPLGQIKIPTAPKGEWAIVVAKEGYTL